MTIAVLPVKAPAAAKSRLAALFNGEERERLAWLLYRRTLGVLLSASRFDKVVVVSSDSDVLEYARRRGAQVMAESTQQSHSHSADKALAHCSEMGASRVLLVPIDVPLLTAADIEQVLEAPPRNGEPAVVIVPSSGGTGTNGLLQSPPAAIPCRFGPGSFEAHRGEAAQRGVALTVATPPGLTFDLDDPGDVVALMNKNDAGEISRYLAEISAVERAEEYLSRKHAATRSHAWTEPRAAHCNRMPPSSITLTAIPGMPEIRRGDDLAPLIVKATAGAGIDWPDRPLIVAAQKIISKSEGRAVDLESVKPSTRALNFANLHGKDARVVELVLRESSRIVRMERGIIIAETRHGFVCANAGVDLSNAPSPGQAILLPENPDASAHQLRNRLSGLTSRDCAVIISDTFGRPWRNGLINVAIGAAGLEVLDDLRGQPDSSGRPLQATQNATADDLAAAAGLLMSKSAGIPVVLVVGIDWKSADRSSASDLIRPSEQDLFR